MSRKGSTAVWALALWLGLCLVSAGASASTLGGRVAGARSTGVCKAHRVKHKKKKAKKKRPSVVRNRPRKAKIGPSAEPGLIDIHTITRPEDIDFDSVAPPSGVPEQYVSEKKTASPRPPASRKADPSISESLRRAMGKDPRPRGPTVGASASDTAAKAPASPRRVVYTAGSD